MSPSGVPTEQGHSAVGRVGGCVIHPNATPPLSPFRSSRPSSLSSPAYLLSTSPPFTNQKYGAERTGTETSLYPSSTGVGRRESSERRSSAVETAPGLEGVQTGRTYQATKSGRPCVPTRRYPGVTDEPLSHLSLSLYISQPTFPDGT